MNNAKVIVLNVNKKKKKQKKGTIGLSMMGRMLDIEASTGKVFIDEYIHKHRESNKKTRDGWLIHLGSNLYKAGGKAKKKVKLSKIVNIF